MSQSASRSRQLGVHKLAMVLNSEVVSLQQTRSLPRLLPVYFLKIHFVLTAEYRGTTPINIKTNCGISVIVTFRKTYVSTLLLMQLYSPWALLFLTLVSPLPKEGLYKYIDKQKYQYNKLWYVLYEQTWNSILQNVREWLWLCYVQYKQEKGK